MTGDNRTTLLTLTTTQGVTTTEIPKTSQKETTTTTATTTTTTKTTTTTRVVEASETLYPVRPPLTKEFARTNRILEVVADLPTSSKQTMGYSALELILDCEFAGSKCDMRYVDIYIVIFGPSGDELMQGVRHHNSCNKVTAIDEIVGNS